jgi:hypothetical protein
MRSIVPSKGAGTDVVVEGATVVVVVGVDVVVVDDVTVVVVVGPPGGVDVGGPCGVEPGGPWGGGAAQAANTPEKTKASIQPKGRRLRSPIRPMIPPAQSRRRRPRRHSGGDPNRQAAPWLLTEM